MGDFLQSWWRRNCLSARARHITHWWIPSPTIACIAPVYYFQKPCTPLRIASYAKADQSLGYLPVSKLITRHTQTKKKSTNERADRSLTRKRTVYPPPRPRVRYDTVRSQSIVRQPPFEIPCSNSRSHANFFWQLPVHHSKPDTGYSSRHEKDMKKIRASSFVVTQPNIHRSTIATVDADTSSLHDYNLGGLLMSSKKSKISLLTLSTIVSTSLSVMLKGGAIMMWSPRSPSTVPDPG